MIYVPKKGDVIDIDLGYGEVTALILTDDSKSLSRIGFRFYEITPIMNVKSDDYRDAKKRGKLNIEGLSDSSAMIKAFEKVKPWHDLKLADK